VIRGASIGLIGDVCGWVSDNWRVGDSETGFCRYRNVEILFQVAPYSAEIDVDDDDWDTSKGIRAMALAYVPDLSQAAFGAVIGPDGDCVEHIRFPNIVRRKHYDPAENEPKEADLKVG